ncbi:hypothetical protein CCO03_10585 [Comamonas serinivorans]|uniref:Uncharacterized protein n=1 Tax=Comamonas serinivorans TaxID=1082851 RepID=A0A1Y0EN94_9BURK|nr:hypothetical protein [Comamonas serinivorans]ARU05077.1 hypothetical protein CCO03_10585 [Comamonas serinivorans]
MTAVYLLNHLFNFIAPALWLAVFLPGVCRLLWRGAPARLSLVEQMGVQLVVGVLVLLAGLVVLGRDGAMLTYAMLVALAAVGQWLMQR